MDNDIPTGYLEQVRDFVLKVHEEETAKAAFSATAGSSSSSSSSAGGAAAAAGATAGAGSGALRKLRTAPVLSAVAIGPLVFDKVKSALLVKSDAVSASPDAAVRRLALTMDERAALDPLFEVIANEGLYHSTKLPPRAVAAIVAKCPMWPAADCAAAYDLLRKLCLHADGCETYLAPKAIVIATQAIARAADAASPFGTRATSIGLLANLLVKAPTRDLLLELSGDMAEAAATVSTHEKPMVRSRAALVVHNAAAALANHVTRTDRALAGNAALEAAAAKVAAAALAIALPADTTDPTRATALAGLATALLMSPEARSACSRLDADAKLVAMRDPAKARTQVSHAVEDAIEAMRI